MFVFPCICKVVSHHHQLNWDIEMFSMQCTPVINQSTWVSSQLHSFTSFLLVDLNWVTTYVNIFSLCVENTFLQDKIVCRSWGLDHIDCDLKSTRNLLRIKDSRKLGPEISWLKAHLARGPLPRAHTVIKAVTRLMMREYISRLKQTLKYLCKSGCIKSNPS